MCYPVCGMINIKDSLLLIRKSIPHSGSIGFLFLRLILHGGPIELFLVPASAPRLVYQRPWYVLSCLWDDAYKRTLAFNRKRVAHVVAAGFLSCYLCGTLPFA